MQSVEFTLSSDASILVRVEEIAARARFAIGVTADLHCIQTEAGLRRSAMIELNLAHQSGRFSVQLNGRESRFWLYLVRLEGGENWWLPGMVVEVMEGTEISGGVRFKCNVWCDDMSEYVVFHALLCALDEC